MNEPLDYYPDEENIDVVRVEYAGFWLRVVAIMLDVIFMVFIIIFLFRFIDIIDIIGIIDSVGSSSYFFYFIMVRIVAVWFYFAFMESSQYQATFGKLIVGLKVTDMHGRRISFGRATGRYFAKILSYLILYVGFFMAGFTEKKQGLHDIVAECLVVRGDGS